MTEIRFAGFGGQGIIRSGIIIGKAVSIFDEKFATMNQSFGPEARGGACSAQIVLSDEQVLYPYVTVPDILVAMSQEAYTTYESELGEGGILIIDADLVRPRSTGAKIRLYTVPATRFSQLFQLKSFFSPHCLLFLTANNHYILHHPARLRSVSSFPVSASVLFLPVDPG